MSQPSAASTISMSQPQLRIASPANSTACVMNGTALPVPAKIGLKRGTTAPSSTTTAITETAARNAG